MRTSSKVVRSGRGWLAGSVELAATGILAAAMSGAAMAQSAPAATQQPSSTQPATPAGSQSGSAPGTSAPAGGTQTNVETGEKTAAPANTKADSKPETKADTTKADTSADAKFDSKLDTAANSTAVSMPTQKPANVKAGSIDDINAVGTRDIGGRGMGNWYSTETEIKIGKEYSMQVEKSARLITDPVITEYVNRVGQNIVKNSDSKVPFTIKVVDSDEINAFALPGGYFYVNSGLILAADEESELAGVMAHEIAHVAAHHQMREMTRMNYANIGMIPVMIFVGGWTGYGIYEGAQLAIPMTFLHFERGFEEQADYLGVQYMYRAGYDPQSFTAFFEKIQALEKQKPGLLSKAFSTHPQTPDRIQKSQEEIARILPARPEYVVSTSEFDDVKARLARIENKRKLNDDKDGKKPTLRRVGSTDNTDSNGNSKDDDRPTLHPRSN